MPHRHYIFTALQQTHQDDLETIRKYIAFVKFRRTVTDVFYFAAHWVRSGRRHHWVGSS